MYVLCIKVLTKVPKCFLGGKTYLHFNNQGENVFFCFEVLKALFP